eukprot:jgi/Pico_ML_1/55915/g1527.t1
MADPTEEREVDEASWRSWNKTRATQVAWMEASSTSSTRTEKCSKKRWSPKCSAHPSTTLTSETKKRFRTGRSHCVPTTLPMRTTDRTKWANKDLEDVLEKEGTWKRSTC